MAGSSRTAQGAPHRASGASRSAEAPTISPGASATEGGASPLEPLTQAHDKALARLSRWVEKKGGNLGVTVFDLTASRPVTSLDDTKPRNPASVSKLLTARVALSVLGPAHQFTTTYHGQLDKGHVPRLVIRGDGDPTITTNDLRSVANELALLGLKSVDRELAVEQGAFDDQYVPDAFEQQPNEWAAFRAPVCATAVDRNRLTIRVIARRAGEPAVIVVEPPRYAEVKGGVDTAKAASKAAPRVSVEAQGERVRVLLSGSIAEGAPPFVAYRRVEDPRRIIALALAAMLRERGIHVAERVEVLHDDALTLPVLVTTKSDALAVILRRLGKDSDNFTAEMLLRAASAKATGQGSGGAGAKLVLDYLEGLGPVESGTRFVNGSGLFDANRLSTSAIVRVLAEIYYDERYYPEFASQLSLGHIDGTLRSRFADLADGCRVRAKTGTLAAVSSLAGYLETVAHHQIAFAAIVEGITDTAALKPELDAFVSSLCAL